MAARFDAGTELRHTRVVKSVGTTPSTAGTRERVLSLLLELGPSTTADLSERLGVSAAGIRRHLDALVVDGRVTTRSP
ncbi:MAG: putative transcriptional regulator, partial [Frankiales bacterium]|nr:putative transcriptional regulator [Frankiales bacterium]